MEAVMEIPVIRPDESLERKAFSLPAQAKAVIITDQATYDIAASLLLDVAAMRKEITAYHAPLKQAAHDSHKRICEAEAKMLAPISEAERTLKTGIAAYTEEQRRIEEQRRREAEEQARKKAEEDALAAAIEAEEQGATQEEVAAVLAEPVVVPRVAPAPVFKPAAGVSVREVWAAEICDVKALCRAIGEGKASQEFVSPNMTALNAQARSLKKTMNIPGVRAVCLSSVASRGGAR